MRLALLVLFIVAPLMELAVLIELGRQIGFWWTILIVVATAVVGTAILQQQGLETMARINRAMAAGIPPVEPVVEGFFLLIAGAFLITPGIITDTIGFVLLVPAFRRHVAGRALTAFLAHGTVDVRTQTSESAGPGPGGTQRPRNGPGSGPVIDGEFERVDENTKPTKPRAPHQDVDQNPRRR